MSVTFEVEQVQRPTAMTEGDAEVERTVAGAIGKLLQQQRPTIEACGVNVPIGRNLVTCRQNPLVSAALRAYNFHYPLELSPDTVWLTIAQGLAIHVKQNAEALRSRFVKHEGKERITVRRDDFAKGSPENDWPGVFSEFSEQISKLLIGKQRDLIVADFSTTGPIEKAASEVVLMDAMQHYLSYRVMTCCGIPEITLLGTVDDWKEIRTRVHVFAEYGLSWWTEALLPVLDQFIAAMTGKVEKDFWNRICKVPGGSGGTRICGWINRLFPYIDTGTAYTRNKFASTPLQELNNRQRMSWDGPQASDFPLGLSKVPFTWQYFQDEFPMEFLAGLVGVAQHPESLVVAPVAGWAVQDAK